MIPIRDQNPSGSFPAVTLALIAACTVAFVYELAMAEEIRHFFAAYALVPGQVTYGLQSGTIDLGAAALPFFTSMFLHGGWFHLIGNMWFLWIFGDNIEDALGSFRFLIFYLLCGVLAGLTHYFISPLSAVPTVGASGAIAGVLGGYLLLFPGARVVTLVPLGFVLQFVELPAFLVLGIWLLAQAFSGVLSLGMQGGGIAWWAHIGGFLAGLLLVLPFRRRVMV